MPADYDGDRIDDSRLRPSNGTGTEFSTNGAPPRRGVGHQLGHSRAGGLRRDGTAGLAVFRPSTGTWLPAILQHGRLWRGQVGTTAADVPSPAILMATVLATLRSQTGRGGRGTCGTRSHWPRRRVPWGNGPDIPVAAIMTADNLTDLAVFRPSTGTWHNWFTGTGATFGTEWGMRRIGPARTVNATETMITRRGSWRLLVPSFARLDSGLVRPIEEGT